jgi:hypothetical protein
MCEYINMWLLIKLLVMLSLKHSTVHAGAAANAASLRSAFEHAAAGRLT